MKKMEVCRRRAVIDLGFFDACKPIFCTCGVSAARLDICIYQEIVFYEIRHRLQVQIPIYYNTVSASNTDLND